MSGIFFNENDSLYAQTSARRAQLSLEARPNCTECGVNRQLSIVSSKSFIVQKRLPIQKRFFAFNMIFIRHATIYRTYGSALRLVMKAFTFGTFSWDDVIDIV